MTLDVVVRFLSEVVRSLFGTGIWCAVMQIAHAAFGVTPMPFVIPPNPTSRNPLHAVAATDAGTFVVTFVVGRGGADRAFYREIAKVGRTGLDEPVRVRIPATPRSTWTIGTLSDGFVVTGNDWWYVTLDDHDDAAATTFVRSDGSTATYARPQLGVDASNATHSNSWHTIVVPGEKPRALELTYDDDATIAREVEWSGPARSWRLPPAGNTGGRMVAQPLPDGRIALISNQDGLSLFLLADDGHVDAIALRNVRIQQFDAVVDHAGRLAIVAARNAILPSRGVTAAANDTGTIDAAIIDPAHPQLAEWSSLRHDVRVTTNLRDVHVVATPDGFAAAWINEVNGKRIEATDIDARGHGGAVFEVGQASSRNDAFLGVEAKNDALLFWWDDGEHLFQRRLPASLNGYAALTDFAQHFCSEAEPQH